MRSNEIMIEQDSAVAGGKLKWPDHEMVLAGILVVLWIAYCIRPLFVLSAADIDAIYASVYRAHGLPFNYMRNVLVPRAGAGLLIWLTYLAIVKVIIPLFRTIAFKAPTANLVRSLVLSVASLFATAWLLSLGVNGLTALAHPWWFNYADFHTLSIFGYNERPFETVWTGFEAPFFIVCMWTLIFTLRFVIVWWLERPGGARAYRILITNQCTLFALIYFAIMAAVAVMWGITYKFVILYCLFVPPTFLVFMVNTYYIFPRKKQSYFWEARSVITMLLYTIPCIFPFFLLEGINIPHGLFVAFLNCLLFQWLVTTPISWFLFRERKDRILQLRGVEKELVKSKADLQFLRSQINPHFLFNALNTLYGTALRENAPDAAAGIQQLGDMMRFMLHDNLQDFIPLEREKEYLSNYLALQKLRVQSHPGITIESDITGSVCTQVIAPMLLIPFVENAFKHGISLRQPTWIRVMLSCSDKEIRFEVRNSMVAAQPGDPEKEYSGVGLQNVRERLALIYPGRHGLHIHNDGREFYVQLTIQA